MIDSLYTLKVSSSKSGKEEKLVLQFVNFNDMYDVITELKEEPNLIFDWSYHPTKIYRKVPEAVESAKNFFS